MLDSLGLRLVLTALSLGWFTWLWGVGVPALLAGLALSVMLQLALRRGRTRLVEKRETALRQRLGGEMVLEDLLYCPEHQAHFRCALLLGQRYPLTMLRVAEGGILCRQARETLLVMCLPLPPDEEASATMLLSLARRVRESGADRGVVCVTGKIGRGAQTFAETAPVKLRLIDRQALLTLAGRASPATDGQLVALGRRRQRMPLAATASAVLQPDKARRFLACGLGLTLMYLITRLKWYPIPALACLTLAALCRLRKAPPDAL